MNAAIPIEALVLVLVAAVMHATWNALIKSGADRLAGMVLIQTGGALVCAPVLFFHWRIEPEAWLYVIASALVHNAYYVFLVRSYRDGDLSQVYPLARGSSPLLVAAFSYAFAGESLGPVGIFAVIAVCAAILSLAFSGRDAAHHGRTVFFALGTGVFIAIYTVIDGLGGRASGNTWAYIAILGVLEPGPIALFAWWRRREALWPALRANLWRGLAGGVIAWTGYGLVIWAMTVAPMTYVSALR
ncbi:MAG: EamA family transporter, partial [Alphaproteobacteria bacterium]|nr:EamA family transporter [Alphaproteobacteria bacterium]